MENPTLPFTQKRSEQQQRLGVFRRALRAEDQMALDALFEQARRHIPAAVSAANPVPDEAFFVSVMIETWKLIDTLETRLSDLEKQLKAIKASPGGSSA